MVHIKIAYAEGEGFGENRIPSVIYSRINSEGYVPTRIEINFDVEAKTGEVTFYFKGKEELDEDTIFNGRKPSAAMLEKMILKGLENINVLEVVE